MSEGGDNRPMQHDPVCGMTVDPSKAAATAQYQGVTVYFCSQDCAAQFRAAPEKYAQAGPLTADSPRVVTVRPQGQYTCPMHPEINKSGPGNCPKCGMALEPITISAPARLTEYTCPMHPQIVRDAPGACPICGMALEPRDVTAEETNPELSDMTRRLWFSAGLACRC